MQAFSLFRLGFRRLKEPLFQNASFLMLSSILGGLLGFPFWLIAARFYPAADVGITVSLLAVASLLGALSSLGLETGLVRFLPAMQAGRRRRLNAALTLSAVTAAGVALSFLGGLSLWAPALAFVGESWAFSAALLGFTVAFALTHVVDAGFLAGRRASYHFARTLLFHGTKLPLPILLGTFLGALGLLLSFGVALLLALTVALFVLLPRLYTGFRPTPIFQVQGLRELFTYSVGNHVANVLRGLPSGLLPLLVLLQVSASGAAHFYVAWLLAGLLFVIPLSTASSLFVEGSHPGTVFSRDTVRSLRFGLLLIVPGVLLLVFGGDFLLGLFGVEYSTGLGLLQALAVSALFVTVNATFFAYLRVRKRIPELVLLSLFGGLGTLLGGVLLLPAFGLMGPGLAFLLAEATITGYVVLKHLDTSLRVARELVRI